MLIMGQEKQSTSSVCLFKYLERLVGVSKVR